MGRFLGIDLGTSFFKAAILDLDQGQLRNIRRLPTPEPVAGLAANEKSCTASVVLAVCVMLPLVPVMVSVVFPAGVEFDVETFSVAYPEPLRELGLKLAAAPVGKPLTLNDSVPLNPLRPVVEML